MTEAKGFSQADVQRMIDEAQERTRQEHRKEMETLRSSHDDEIAGLRAALTGTATVSPVASHAGGPDTDIAPTWSAYDQMLASRGEHPWQNGEHAPWQAHPDHVRNVRGIAQPDEKAKW